MTEKPAVPRESNFCIYMIESRARRERIFRPWPKEGFWVKRDAIARSRELTEKFAHKGRQFRVKDYWDQRPW